MKVKLISKRLAREPLYWCFAPVTGQIITTRIPNEIWFSEAMNIIQSLSFTMQSRVSNSFVVLADGTEIPAFFFQT